MGNISVIIVNYNTADLLCACLKSLFSQQEFIEKIIVVDNASTDGSQDMAEKEFPQVFLIKSKENLGFAKANNLGLSHAKGRYIYFLNPDTKVMPGALKAMEKFMGFHSYIGLAGTKILNPDKTLQESVETRYPGQKYAKDFLRLKGSVAWVSGASMIARKDVIDDIGGFDEDFFLYAEEVDLCLRIRKKGREIGFIEDAVIIHWGGQSERGNMPYDVWKKKFNAELLFYKKHYSEKTVKAIKKANRLQALWRIFTLNLTGPFYKNNSDHTQKLEKYKLILKMFR